MYDDVSEINSLLEQNLMSQEYAKTIGDLFSGRKISSYGRDLICKLYQKVRSSPCGPESETKTGGFYNPDSEAQEILDSLGIEVMDPSTEKLLGSPAGNLLPIASSLLIYPVLYASNEIARITNLEMLPIISYGVFLAAFYKLSTKILSNIENIDSEKELLEQFNLDSPI